MEEYIIKSSAGIAIGFTLYRFLLRNSTSFKWLRIYFLCTIAASFLLPALEQFFKFRQKTWVQIPSEYIAAFLSSSDASINKQFSENTFLDSYSVPELVFYLYLFGVSVFLARFLFGFIQLAALLKMEFKRLGMTVWCLFVIFLILFPFCI